MNAKNVLTPNNGWNWSSVVAAEQRARSPACPTGLGYSGATGRLALINTPEYPQKNLYHHEHR